MAWVPGAVSSTPNPEDPDAPTPEQTAQTTSQEEISQLTPKEQAMGPARTYQQKVEMAEQFTALAKAQDLEDTREESSGYERHDLLSGGKELNIPPTIWQERLRNGQNPETGQPWSREQRMEFDKNQEQARQEHAKNVRKSELQMREELAGRQQLPPFQPVSHVAYNFLTDAQRKAMQEVQDAGGGVVAQATARDMAAPDYVDPEVEAQMLEEIRSETEPPDDEEDTEEEPLSPSQV